MRQKALAERPDEDDNNGSTSLALAVEPDASQAEALVRMLGASLTVVASVEDGLVALNECIPDVILVSPLLAPQDEEQIVSRVAALGSAASHVQLLTIPRVGDQEPAEKKRRFGWKSSKAEPGAGSGCDPIAFANQVAEYLAHASRLRQQRDAVNEPAAHDIEHIEQLLERLDADPPPPLVGDQPPVPKRDLMAMSTTHEPTIGTPRASGEMRLPRFLTLDDQVPLPLRALLDEADGCLKMSFLTGAGACASRTLDLLLAEQGLGDGDRADQLLQLGKKHPAVAESFLRGLALVTNHPGGAWDEPRVTLAIAILKAIAYEIYVLGPERKERAAYVIELLERYKAVGKA